MKSVKKLLAGGILLPCLLGAGENMFYNSSFEMGMDGWDHGMTQYKYPYDPKTPNPRKWIAAKDAPHGKYVMQVTNHKSMYKAWTFTSPDVTLVPGKTYTVSFYIKPEKTGNVTFLVNSNHYEVWHSAVSMSFSVKAGQWQRVHKTFTYKPKKNYPELGYHTFFLLFLAPGENTNGLTYQFDALQLEEGKLTDYKPAAAVEYKVTTPELYLTDSKVKVDFSALSYAKGTKVTRELILTDTGKNQILQKKKISFNLTADKQQTVRVTFDKLPYGGFKIHAVDTSKATAVDFVRIRPNKELYQKGKYAVGIGSSALGVFTTPWNKGIDMAVPVDAYRRDAGEIVRLAGATVSSSFDGGSSRVGSLLPNKRGEYDWLRNDIYFKRLRELKLKAFTGLASQTLMTQANGRQWGKAVPDWLRKLDRFGHPEGTYQGGWDHVRIIMPPANVISEIAAAICKRYKDDICMFRIFAEANGYMKAPQLVEYSKACYIDIKKAAPDVLVNTVCPTEDGGSEMGGYFSEFLRSGGIGYTDTVTFHPYKSSQDDSATSAMSNIDAFYKAMKRAGVKYPLAETECFYLISNPYNNQPEYTWSLFEPAAITRRMLIDMGEGLIMSIPLTITHLHQPVASNDGSSRGYFTKVPNARFAAHNAMGYLLNGAVNPSRVYFPGNELCYTFENRGKKYSAVWCISGRTVMNLNLPAGVTCKAYDIYGNITKTASKSLSLTLDRQPQIIEWSGNADPKMIHAQGEYIAQQFMLFYGVKQTDNGVNVLLSNRTQKPLSGFIKLNSDYLETSRISFKDLKPYIYTSVFVPAKIKANAPKVFDVTAVCGANGKLVTKKLSLKQVPVLLLNKDYKVGPHSFKLEKKGDKLFVTASLASKKAKVAADPAQPWNGDSLEFFCDFVPGTFNPNNPDGFNDNCVQFVIPASSSGSPNAVTLQNRKKVKMTDIKVVRTADGAKVKAAVPFRKGMNVNIHFNAEGKCTVFNGRQNFQNRSGYAVLTSK